MGKGMMLLLIFMSLSLMAVAQQEDVAFDNWPTLKYAGQVFQLKWLADDDHVKLFVTGHVAAVFTIKDFDLKVSQSFGQKEVQLPVGREKDHFSVMINPDLDDLKVKLRVNQDEVGDFEVPLR